MTDFSLKKHASWHFPLKASYPEYINKYLDDTLGRNEHHNLEEREDFVQRLYKSLSLDVTIKKRILKGYSNLSPFQLDELTKVFKEETHKFTVLEAEHPEDIKKLIIKRGVAWLFSLDKLEDIDTVLLDLIYYGEISNDDINTVLKYVKNGASSKCLITVFENQENKHHINNESWNYYLNALSNEKGFEKLSKLLIPKNVETDFLKACRTSYLLRDLSCEYVNKEHLKDIFIFIRSEKRKLIKAQFINDALQYYLHKNKNLDKYILRTTNLVINLKFTPRDFVDDFNSLHRTITYINNILFLFNENQIYTILKGNYLILKRWLDIFEKKHNSSDIINFYIENNDLITDLASDFLINSTSKVFFYNVMSRNENLVTSPLIDIIFQISNNDNDDYIKHSIDFLILNEEVNDGSCHYLYSFLLSKGKKDIASHLLKKYKGEFPETNVENSISLFSKAKLSSHTIINQSFSRLKSHIKKSINEHKLNTDFAKYKENDKPISTG
jgi:hypothetical protein